MVASLAWGGYSNGYIPAAAMSPIGGGFLLEAGTARQFLAAAAELRNSHGITLVAYVSETYRDFAGQIYQRTRWTALGQPNNAAVPGSSVHGWAKAVDFNADALNADGIYDIVMAVLAKYGFIRDISGESWHVSYREAQVTTWASGSITPFEEDDMYDAAAREELIGSRIDQTIIPLLRAILAALGNDDAQIERILDAIRRESRPRVYQIKDGEVQASRAAAIDVDEGYFRSYGSAAELDNDKRLSLVAPEAMPVTKAEFDELERRAKARLAELVADPDVPEVTGKHAA